MNPFDVNTPFPGKPGETRGGQVSTQPSIVSAGKAGAPVEVRQELVNAPNIFLSRCELFLDRSKAVKDVDLMFELQKIFSSGKYMLSVMTSSEKLRKATLVFETGTMPALNPPGAPNAPAAPGPAVRMPAPDGTQAWTGELLLVDDDATLLEMLKLFLEQLGHTVTTARSGKEALSSLHLHDFDIALIDLMMPEMDGYQLLTYFKADMKWRDIPVIILSGLRETSSAAQCLELGAADYLTKPIDPILLRTRINSTLEQRKLRDMTRQFVKGDFSKAASIPAEAGVIPAMAKNATPSQLMLLAEIGGFARAVRDFPEVEIGQPIREMFTALERLAQQHKIGKANTNIDTYVVVGAIPPPAENHIESIAGMTSEMEKMARKVNTEVGTQLKIRFSMEDAPES